MANGTARALARTGLITGPAGCLPEILRGTPARVIARLHGNSLPLTPNGKVDMSALPSSASTTGVGRAPRIPQEQLLCEPFAEVLDLPLVGIDQDFFVLGGHSVLVARLIAHMRATMGAELGYVHFRSSHASRGGCAPRDG